MRKHILLGLAVSLVIISCGDSKKEEAQQYLLSTGAVHSVDEIKGEFASALFFKAVEQQKWDVVRALCSAGMDLNARDTNHFSRSPLAAVAAAGRVDCVRLLLEAGADDKDKALYEACCGGYDECIKELLDAGADVNFESGYGWTPILTAAANGHDACVKLLLEAGANVNVKNGRGETLLMRAIQDCEPETVRLIREAGAEQ